MKYNHEKVYDFYRPFLEKNGWRMQIKLFGQKSCDPVEMFAKLRKLLCLERRLRGRIKRRIIDAGKDSKLGWTGNCAFINVKASLPQGTKNSILIWTNSIYHKIKWKRYKPNFNIPLLGSPNFFFLSLAWKSVNAVTNFCTEHRQNVAS